MTHSSFLPLFCSALVTIFIFLLFAFIRKCLFCEIAKYLRALPSKAICGIDFGYDGRYWDIEAKNFLHQTPIFSSGTYIVEALRKRVYKIAEADGDPDWRIEASSVQSICYWARMADLGRILLSIWSKLMLIRCHWYSHFFRPFLASCFYWEAYYAAVKAEAFFWQNLKSFNSFYTLHKCT